MTVPIADPAEVATSTYGRIEWHSNPEMPAHCCDPRIAAGPWPFAIGHPCSSIAPLTQKQPARVCVLQRG